MLEIVKYKEWVIEVDRIRTEEVFRYTEEGKASYCKCSDCENYAAQNRENYFPNEVKSLFKLLGIDLLKEADVVRECKLENGLHKYEGWFNIKAKKIEGRSCYIPLYETGDRIELVKISDNFEIGFHKGAGRSRYRDDESSELLMVYFSTNIAWVIDRETVFPI